ncbi:hypothetical protein AB6A68_10985 [Ferrimicrobium acidiphilum]|uniref:TrbL/VirB6 plasmid conjugal transfer protein n=2 Tax=Ferrimicrobium acidiphilum TaxID=121039 RepID=A0ABV3Y472_9ACTN
MPNLNPMSVLTSLLSSGVKSLAGSAFQAIAKYFSDAATKVCVWLWQQIGSAAAIQLGGSGFDRLLGILMAIAVVVGMGLFLIQIIQSILRRDVAGLGRAAKGLLIAFLGGAVAITITNLLLSATDSLSNGVVQAATGGSMTTLGNSIMSTTALTAIQNPAALLILSLIIIVSAVVIWAALTVRKLLIILAAVFGPLAFAGALADISTGWVKKWIEGMIALIASKLILVTILITGFYTLVRGLGAVGAAGAPSGTQAVTQVASGGLLLLMGGLAPWIALKTVHFTSDHMSQLHGQAGNVKSVTQTAVAAPQKVSAMGQQVVGGGVITPRSPSPHATTGSTGPSGSRGPSGSTSQPGSVTVAEPAGAGAAAAGATFGNGTRASSVSAYGRIGTTPTPTSTPLPQPNQ